MFFSSFRYFQIIGIKQFTLDFLYQSQMSLSRGMILEICQSSTQI